MTSLSRRAGTLAAAVTGLTLLASGCTGDGPQAPKPRSATPTSKSKAATRPVAEAKAAPSPAVVARWTPAVQQDYKALKALPKDAGPQVIKGVLRLARRGAAAGEALAALHDDSGVSPRMRAMAGVMVANLRRYDPQALGALLASPLPHVARHAALLLSQLGQTGITVLVARANKLTDKNLAAQLKRHASTASKTVAPKVLALLHRLQTSTDASKKQWAGTELAVSHIAVAEPFLLRMLREAVADSPTRLQATLALVEGYAKKPQKLKQLADRRHPPQLRLAACQELLKHGKEGRAAVEAFAQKPGDPLANSLKTLLAAGAGGKGK